MNLAKTQVFFDFDNTLTSFDVLDDIIKRFSPNEDWLKFERDWLAGKIGSKECLQGQLRSVRIDNIGLFEYLSKIKIDPYFVKLLALLKQNGVEPIILSDSFSLIIEYILRSNGLKGIKVYSNRLKFQKNRLIPYFPHRDKTCNVCGHCKRNNLLKNTTKDKMIIYIGDGLSDICPAKEADVVFAKGRLKKHFEKLKRQHIAINDLGDVYKYFMVRKV